MADVERLPSLQIPVGYEYDDSGIKAAINGVNRVSTKSLKDVDRIDGAVGKLFKKLDKMLSLTQGGGEKTRKAAEAAVALKDKELKLEEKIAKARRTVEEQQWKVAGKEQSLANKDKVVMNGVVKTIDKSGEIVTDAQETASYISTLNRASEAVERLKNLEAERTQVAVQLKQAIQDVGSARINDEIEEQARLQEEAKRAEEEKAEAIRREREEQARLVEEMHRQIEANKALVRQKISDTIDKVNAKLKTLTQRLKNIDVTQLIAKFYVLKRLWTYLTSFVDSASSWVENLNLLESVFGDTSDAAKEFVETVSNNFGLNANTIAQIAATFKQMANAMGQASETGTAMSEALTYLALDLSSLRNMDVEDVSKNLVSGISGQSRAVVKYGSNITQDAINEWLKANDLYNSSLSQQQKQIIRTILLIEQQRDSWGDMAKTINTFANQQRVLNDQIEVFKKNIGSVLIGTFQLDASFEEASETAGILTKAIWWINGALIAVNTVLSAIVPSIDSLNGATSSLSEDVESDMEDLEESTSGALASFDKFNTLGTGSGGLGDTATTAALIAKLNETSSEYLTEVNKKLSQVSMFANDIATKILKTFFPEFEKWLNENPDGLFSDWAEETGALSGRLDGLKQGLSSILTIVLTLKSPLAGIFAMWAKSYDDPMDMIKQIVEWAGQFNEIIQKLGPQLEAFLTKLVPIVETVLKIISNIADWIVENNNLEATIWLLVAAFGAWKIITIANSVTKAVTQYRAFNAILKQTKLAQEQVAAATLKAASAQEQANTAITTAANNSAKATPAINALAVGFSACSIALTVFELIGDASKELQLATSIVVGFVAAIVALAIGLTSLKESWGGIAFAAALGIAIGGAVSAVKSGLEINAHADGGFQSGGLFYAGEAGPEWVGRQGNTSTILNDSQMSDIMRDSVAQGVTVALAKSGGLTQSTSSGVGNVYLDGDKVGTFVAGNKGFRSEANRRNTGLKWR